MNRDGFFIEVDCCQLSEKGQIVSGESCIQQRHQNRVTVVLADGVGSGVKGSVIAGVISSMAINYTLSEDSALRAAKAIVRTFVTQEEQGGREQAAARCIGFTILDIHRNGTVRVTGFGNPRYILLRNGQEIQPPRREVAVEELAGHTLSLSDFRCEPEDRIILLSDGVTASGRLTRRMPEGWGRDGVIAYAAESVMAKPTLSASKLCRGIVGKAELNDLFAPKNDMTCAVLYLRQPRRIMVCTGPPFKEQKDEILADMVARYPGTKLICGGTTAQIVSRELNRPIAVVLKRDPAGLPPTSTMEGVDLITEGVLTLSKVKSLLEHLSGSEVTQKGTDGVVARMLLEHDVIDFVVGTRINPLHQDPSLPVELELRRNLIKELGRLLETKFMKEVKIQYI